VGIITTQVLGDLVDFLMGDFVRGGTGFAIAGALLFYLLRPRSEPLLSVARCRVCDDECELSDNGTAWHDDKLWG